MKYELVTHSQDEERTMVTVRFYEGKYSENYTFSLLHDKDQDLNARINERIEAELEIYKAKKKALDSIQKVTLK